MTARYGLVVLIVATLGNGLTAQQPPPAKPAPSAEATPPAPPVPPQPRNQPVNVRVEVTITEQRGKASPTRKLLSMIAADGFRNSIRSQETFFPPMEVPLNVDVTPTILTGSRGENTGKIRLMLNLEYDLPGAAGGAEKKTSTGEWERVTMKSSVRENLYVIVDDGKPLVVAQSADPVSDRQVTVEVRATVLK
jgi:hypothetical protein